MHKVIKDTNPKGLFLACGLAAAFGIILALLELPSWSTFWVGLVAAALLGFFGPMMIFRRR